MTIQNSEFEILIKGSASNIAPAEVGFDNSSLKSIKLVTNGGISLYQDWSFKTSNLNNNARRKIFTQDLVFFKEVLEKLKHKNITYKPSCVVKTTDHKFSFVTIEEFSFSRDFKTIYILFNENFSQKTTVSRLSNTDVILNLSSLPYNLLNVHKNLSERKIPWGDEFSYSDDTSNILNDLKLGDPQLSFILRNIGDIKVEGGIATVVLPASCKLTGYEQWSINSLNNKETRSAFCLDTQEFVTRVDEHNRKNRSNEFTPTTTLYIGNNENPLLGKIQSFEIYDINMNTKSGGLSQGKFTKFMNTDEMSMNTGDISSSNLKLKITIDLNNMNNTSPVNDNNYENILFYMNIDDTAKETEITIQTIRDRISNNNSDEIDIVKTGEVLNIPDSNGEYLIGVMNSEKSKKYRNRGTIRILNYGELNSSNQTNFGGIYKSIDLYQESVNEASQLEENMFNHFKDSLSNSNQQSRSLLGELDKFIIKFRTSIEIPANQRFENYGIIETVKPSNSIKISKFIGASHYGSTLPDNEHVNSYILVSEEGGIFENYATINFIPLIISSDFDFAYISDVINYNFLNDNRGIIKFEYIENWNEDKAFTAEICGIRNLINYANGALSSNYSSNSTAGYVYFSKILGTGPQARTCGIYNCLGNNGNIIIDEIRTGVQDTLEGYKNINKYVPSNNSKLGNVNPEVSNSEAPEFIYYDRYILPYQPGIVGFQETCGIKNVGSINAHMENPHHKSTLYKTLSDKKGLYTHKMVTPKAGYDMGYETKEGVPQEIFNEDNKDIVHKLTGNAGNIVINNVINMSPFKNVYSEYVACGIGNLIQLYDNNKGPTTTLHYVTNYGFGGLTASVGIKNVLLNHSAIIIDVVENNSPELLKENLSYLSKTELDDYIPPSAVGVYNCVQNGFCCLNPTGNPDERDHPEKNLINSYLPPYPPQHYDTSGAPTERKNTFESIIQYPAEIDQAYKEWYENLDTHVKEKIVYGNYADIPNGDFDQGQISIYAINNFGGFRTIAEGINRYGGLSYNTNYFSKNSTGILDITFDIYNFVKKNQKASVVWSYPTTMNTSPQDGALVDGYSYCEELTSQINTGWEPDGLTTKDENSSFAPSQLYFAYKPSGRKGYQGIAQKPYPGRSSDIIFFPINWGVVTINSVNTGLYNKSYTSSNPNKDYSESGYSYGIERLITSIGRIQILNISSSIINNNVDLKVMDQTIINTQNEPELSFKVQSSESFIDSPNNRVQVEIPTSINGHECFNDIDVLLYMKHTSGVDPTARIFPSLQTRSKKSVNYKCPYELIPKMSFTEIPVERYNKETDTTYNDTVYESIYTPYIDPTNSTFENLFKSKTTQNTLLHDFVPEGSSYGVFRTIDYGSIAPGLRVLAEFTKPFYRSTDFSQYANGFHSGNVKPWRPTVPAGMAFDNTFYKSGKVNTGRGGFSLRPDYRTIRPLTEYEDTNDLDYNTPLVRTTFAPCDSCVAYVMPGVSEWYKQKLDPINKRKTPITPLVIFDAAAPHFHTMAWFAFPSDLGDEYITMNENWIYVKNGLFDKYKYKYGNTPWWEWQNPINGVDTKSDSGPLGKSKYYLDLEPRNYYGYIDHGARAGKYGKGAWATIQHLGTTITWIANSKDPSRDSKNNYDGARYSNKGPNCWFNMLGSPSEYNYHTPIDPTHYFGGIHQFASYWNALNNNSYNGMYKGTLDENYKMYAISEDNAYNRLLRTEDNPYSPGTPFYREYYGVDGVIDNIYSPAYSISYVDDGIFESRYEKDLSPDSENKLSILPKIRNNLLDKYKIENQLVKYSPEKEGIAFTGIEDEDIAKRYMQPYAKIFRNPYYYPNAPSFRGINWTKYYNNEDNRADLSYQWNIIQSDGPVTPPKYLWKFEGNIHKDVLSDPDFVDYLVEYNLLPSFWPGSTNLPVLLRATGLAEVEGTDIGLSGPYRKYLPYRRENNKDMYWENYFMYNYSSDCPPGFNPQFLQGNILYLKPESSDEAHRSYNYDIQRRGGWYSLEATDDQPFPGSGSSIEVYNTILLENYAWNAHNIKNRNNYKIANICEFNDETNSFISDTGDTSTECYNPGKQFNLVDPLKGSDLLFGGAIGIDTFGSGNTGFSSLSQGNTVIISTHSKNKHLKSKYPVPSSFDLNKEPEMNLLGKYKSDNSFYGFTMERHNYETDMMYNKFYLTMGLYKQYSNINSTVSNLDAQRIELNFREYMKNLREYNKYAQKLHNDYIRKKTEEYADEAALFGKVFNWVMIVIGTIPILTGLAGFVGIGGVVEGATEASVAAADAAAAGIDSTTAGTVVNGVLYDSEIDAIFDEITGFLERPEFK